MPNDQPLSRNEQAMLDLALACDLEMSDTSDQAKIRASHAQIKTQDDAMIYMRAIEHKVRTRRKAARFRAQPGAAASARAAAALTLEASNSSRFQYPQLKRKMGELDQEFAGKYFTLLVGQYNGMNEKAADPSALAEADQLAKNDPATVTWEEIYRFELALLKLEPLDELCRKAWSIRQEYLEVASRDEAAKYTASNPPSDNPTGADEKLLRADLVELQEELNWAYTVMWIQQEYRSHLTRQVIYSSAIPIGLLALVLAVGLFLGQQKAQEIWFVVAVVILCGVMGGVINTIRRVQTVDIGGNADLKLLELEQGNLSVIVSPFLGGVFAVVLACLFASGLIKGELFPAFTSSASSSGFSLDVANYAKLLVWSFIAGFAEQFVPDRLDQLARQNDRSAKQ
jgi:hypothetical protein